MYILQRLLCHVIGGGGCEIEDVWEEWEQMEGEREKEEARGREKEREREGCLEPLHKL
jgi:hypothetical protein